MSQLGAALDVESLREGVVSSYRERGKAQVEILLTSPCVENPRDHRMARSELDSEFETSSQYYDDGAS